MMSRELFTKELDYLIEDRDANDIDQLLSEQAGEDGKVKDLTPPINRQGKGYRVLNALANPSPGNKRNWPRKVHGPLPTARLDWVNYARFMNLKAIDRLCMHWVAGLDLVQPVRHSPDIPFCSGVIPSRFPT